MAISNKGSRKIVVDGTEFRWRATGNDDWISVHVWPKDNPQSRLAAEIGYHQTERPVSAGHIALERQIVITNRLIRRLILHFGVKRLFENTGQIDAGDIESLIDISDALHAEK